MFKLVWLTMSVTREGTVFVNKETETVQDKSIAGVKFNVVSDESCPVYMLNDNGEKIASCDANGLLPLYQWVNGKKTIEEMIAWRSSFSREVFSYSIIAALQCLDLAIARHVPHTCFEESHSVGLPQKSTPKEVYGKYMVEYIDGNNTKSKIFEDRYQAIDAFKKIVGKRPVKVYGFDNAGKHLLKEA